MIKIRFFDISWVATTDGPGTRVVLFLQGCHLRCPWCHSPHSWAQQSPLFFNQFRCIACTRCQEVCSQGVHFFENGIHKINRDKCMKCGRCIESCPTSHLDTTSGALSLPTRDWSPRRLFNHLLPQLKVLKEIGGLTLSGGEALLQAEEVLELLELCTAHKIHTAIETSLTLPTDIYSSVSTYVDCWLVGLREVSFQPGVENLDKLILENLKVLSESGQQIIVRYPVIKGYTDSEEQLNRIVQLMNEGHLKDIEILPCNRAIEHYYTLSGIEPLSDVQELLVGEQELESIIGLLESSGFNVTLVD